MARLPVAWRTVRLGGPTQRVPLGKAQTVDDDEEDLGSVLNAVCQSRGATRCNAANGAVESSDEP